MTTCEGCGLEVHEDQGHSADCPMSAEDFGQTILRPRNGPPAGPRIRLTDGREVRLALPLLLGRNPISEQGAESVAVEDPEFSVSKTHLRVEAEEDQVWVTDLQSTNGTRIILPDGEERWLPPNERTLLGSGARVSFGSQSLTLVPSATHSPAKKAKPVPLPAQPASTASPLIAEVPQSMESPRIAEPEPQGSPTLAVGATAPAPELACPGCGTPAASAKGYCPACGRSMAGALPTEHETAEPALAEPGRPETQTPREAHVVGDITVTDDGVIHTPLGDAPLQGAVWSANEQVTERHYIAQSTIIWAIVLAMFCGLGLLLLLKKEHEATGNVVVSVQSGQLRYSTTIPISNEQDLAAIRQTVLDLQAATQRA